MANEICHIYRMSKRGKDDYNIRNIEPVKKDGKLFFPDGSISLLYAMKKIVASGIAPAATVEVKTTYASSTVEIATKIIGNAVLMLVTENQNLKAQNTTILSKLNTLSIN